ncbi:hypothetical protein [Streptomyces albidocamelliae]|uniref:Uncharacterized protein n=1 Tax=Streptomyces albidocamelliae TaxID=2981135 RepID=A0ABY6EI77_9ACTN|nr:hypothetical protein [Streptomyces sp. HUAS 14-6]UXY34439.1 hypothetical protein N8I86_06680 [Streptomyces sp. HUAS 14-6]
MDGLKGFQGIVPSVLIHQDLGEEPSQLKALGAAQTVVLKQRSAALLDFLVGHEPGREGVIDLADLALNARGRNGRHPLAQRVEIGGEGLHLWLRGAMASVPAEHCQAVGDGQGRVLGRGVGQLEGEVSGAL